ncbi:MAG: WG repeat-containing protein [Rikenellaceae bacterium]
MRVTIDSFKQCLKTPQQSLKTFQQSGHELKVVTDESGEPLICRTTNFAEATIMRVGDGQLFHLSLPLDDSVLRMCERAEVILSQINSNLFGEYSVLRDELQYTHWDGSVKYMDLLLTSIPKGQPIDTFINQNDDCRFIMKAIDVMEAEMAKYNLSYNGMSPRCIIVGVNHNLYMTRLHTIKQGADQSEQRAKEMSMLREWVVKQLDCDICRYAEDCSDVVNSYGNKNQCLDHYLSVSNPFEGIICVQAEDGYHYVDASDSPIFEGTYIWASDFKEGRAEVEISSGMGLIDKSGRYVIPAEFDIVEYDVESGYSRVRKGSKWALYDYSGEQILPFEERYIDEEDIKLIHIK